MLFAESRKGFSGDEEVLEKEDGYWWRWEILAWKKEVLKGGEMVWIRIVVRFSTFFIVSYFSFKICGGGDDY